MKRLALPGIVVGALVAQTLLVASPASAAAVRYAAPTGTGTACTSAAPCSLETAVNAAASGDEVVVNPGAYATATTLSNGGSLDLHGVVGAPRPLITSSATNAVSLTGNGTEVADLTLVHSGSGYGLNVFARTTRVDRVSVTSAGAVACSPGISGRLRDSLCVSTAPGGVAVYDAWGDEGRLDGGTLDLRNVTAVASGVASYGILAEATGDRTLLTVDARNTIASGTAADVRAVERSSSLSQSSVEMRNSNFDTVSEAGGDVSSTSGNGNQTAAPLFLDTTTYRQRPGSPTIDRGGRFDLGTVDLDGDPRITGAAVDIGADELDVTPPDTLLLKPTKKKLRKLKVKFRFAATEAASFVCRVDKKKAKPCASPYKRKFKRYGKHKITITAVDAVGNADPTPLFHKFKIKKKKAKRKKPGRKP